MNSLFRRLSYLLHRRKRDRELASDMEFHREMSARDGGPAFGNQLRLREEARDAWGWTWLEHLLRRELYGISSLDPAAYSASIGIFTLTVALAALIPARRALRLDPLHSLRCE